MICRRVAVRGLGYASHTLQPLFFYDRMEKPDEIVINHEYHYAY